MAETIVCGLFKILPFIWNKLTGIRCNKPMNGLVLPSTCGKSNLCKQLQPHKKEFKLLDLESAVMLEINKEDQEKLKELKDKGEMETYNAKFQVLAKSYIKKLRADFPKTKWILVASSIEILKYVGVPSDAIQCFAPSNEFFGKIKENIDPVMSAIADLSRQNLIVNSGNKQLNVFGDFAELFQIVCRIYNLKQKL